MKGLIGLVAVCGFAVWMSTMPLQERAAAMAVGLLTAIAFMLFGISKQLGVIIAHLSPSAKNIDPRDDGY